MNKLLVFLLLYAFSLIPLTGCELFPEDSSLYESEVSSSPVDREEAIPDDVEKVVPEKDLYPPKSYCERYYDPEPLPYPVNTAGAEDSAFITPCGKTLYFWFTPDVRIPVEKQITDRVTGIYVTTKINGEWSMPERIMLQDRGKFALDGCAFVKGDSMWFCSAREGYEGYEYAGGLGWFKAVFDEEKNTWRDWRPVDFPEEWEVGELHIHGNKLYFHSGAPGGKGGLDIWVSKKDSEGNWGEPENLESVNTERDEGWPAISHDGKELWITRDYGLWRSEKTNGEWGEPELVFSPLAAEASIDIYGNVYFTHHFFKDDKMIEADIYVAYRRSEIE